MDEAMDTSDTVVTSHDGQSINDDSSRQSTMETSPIFERRIVQRTPRTNVVSSDGWIHTRPSRLSPPHLPSHDNASSSQATSASLNVVGQANADIDPPPIEDTDLIMIHRPGSPNLTANQGLSEPGEVAHTPTHDSIDHDMDIANYESPADLEVPLAEIAPEVVVLDDSIEVEATVEDTSRGGEEDPVVVLAPPESDVENLPLAQRIRSPDPIPPVTSPPPKKPKIAEEISTKAEESCDEEEGNLCPICFDAWTNSGAHRLISLRCGHLFGNSCITHWLSIHKANDRKCPQCKKKVTQKDIRPLYASKLRVLDTSELESLKETVKKLEEERDRLSRELAFEKQLKQDAIKIQQEQALKLQQLQHNGVFTPSLPQPLPTQIKISQTNRIEMTRDGVCRVLAFNEWKGLLVASQSAVNSLFPDFGVRVINAETFCLGQIFPMHSKAIRDLSFNPHRKDLLLSTSLDKTAKVFCINSNASIMTFNAEVPLWSCCWDGNNSNIFFAGSQNGTTFQYDIRNTHTEVSRISNQDGGPVVSLAAVPAGSWLPSGGILSCRLNRLRVYERSNNSEFREYPLGIEGPFTALNYDHKSRHMLVTTRPTSQNPHVQHQLYELGFAASRPQTNIVHTFVGGTTQRVMSRPCHLEVDLNVKDTLVCAHQESEGHVAIWSISTGQKIPAGPLHCSEPVMDLCPVKLNNATYLASLSEKTLRIYQFS